MNRISLIKICSLIFLSLCIPTVDATEKSDIKIVYHNPTGKEFPILAGCAFETPDLVTPENFKTIRQCGFNLMESSFTDDQAIRNAIESAQGSGVRILLSTPGVERDSSIPSTVRKYKNDPEIMGYVLSDEPSAKSVRVLRRRRDAVLSESPNQYPFITLLPIYASPKQLGTQNYGEYLEAFADTVKLPILCYDNYPIIVKDGFETLRNNYFENLEIAHDVAARHNVPLWTYVMSAAHLNYPEPTEGHMMFEAFSSLAYGCQGLLYYTYGVPPAFHKIDYKHTPIDRAGHKTATWHRVQKVNKTIQSLSNVFLGAKIERIRHTGAEIPTGTKPLKNNDLPLEFSSIVSQGAGVIVSIFNNNGKRYLMLVNKNFNHPQKVSVRKSDNVKRIFPDGSVKEDQNIKVRLAPGGFCIYTW